MRASESGARASIDRDPGENLVPESADQMEEAESGSRRKQPYRADDATASVAVRARLPLRRASSPARVATFAHTSTPTCPRTSSAAAGAAAARVLPSGSPTLPADRSDLLRPSSVGDSCCDCVRTAANLYAFLHRPGPLVSSASAHASARVANSAMIPCINVLAFVVIDKETVGSCEYFRPWQEKYQDRKECRLRAFMYIEHIKIPTWTLIGNVRTRSPIIRHFSWSSRLFFFFY